MLGLKETSLDKLAIEADILNLLLDAATEGTDIIHPRLDKLVSKWSESLGLIDPSPSNSLTSVARSSTTLLPASTKRIESGSDHHRVIRLALQSAMSKPITCDTFSDTVKEEMKDIGELGHDSGASVCMSDIEPVGPKTDWVASFGSGACGPSPPLSTSPALVPAVASSAALYDKEGGGFPHTPSDVSMPDELEESTLVLSRPEKKRKRSSSPLAFDDEGRRTKRDKLGGSENRDGDGDGSKRGNTSPLADKVSDVVSSRDKDSMEVDDTNYVQTRVAESQVNCVDRLLNQRLIVFYIV